MYIIYYSVLKTDFIWSRDIIFISIWNNCSLSKCVFVQVVSHLRNVVYGRQKKNVVKEPTACWNCLITSWKRTSSENLLQKYNQTESTNCWNIAPKFFQRNIKEQKTIVVTIVHKKINVFVRTSVVEKSNV